MVFLLHGGRNKSRKSWVWGYGISRRNNGVVKKEMFLWRSAESLEEPIKCSGLHIQCFLKFKGRPKFRGLWKKKRGLTEFGLVKLLSTCPFVSGDKQFS